MSAYYIRNLLIFFTQKEVKTKKGTRKLFNYDNYEIDIFINQPPMTAKVKVRAKGHTLIKGTEGPG